MTPQEHFRSPVVRRPSVHPSVCKLSTFLSSSQEPLGQFQPNLAQSILVQRGFKFIRMKGHAIFQGRIITNLQKYIDEILKNYLLKNHWAKFKQTWHKASLGEEDSNEGPCPFPRGDSCNYVIAKIHWRNLKILYSKIIRPILTKLGTKHPWVKGTQVCSNKGPCPFPRGDNYEIAKIN